LLKADAVLHLPLYIIAAELAAYLNVGITAIQAVRTYRSA
jgi:hypothetical protein